MKFEATKKSTIPKGLKIPRKKKKWFKKEWEGMVFYASSNYSNLDIIEPKEFYVSTYDFLYKRRRLMKYNQTVGFGMEIEYLKSI